MVTYANDSFGVKKWDKATGVFIQSSENFGNWSAYVLAIATNMWSPQILGLDQVLFFTVIAVVVVGAIVIIILVMAVRHRKTAMKKRNLLNKDQIKISISEFFRWNPKGGIK